MLERKSAPTIGFIEKTILPSHARTKDSLLTIVFCRLYLDCIRVGCIRVGLYSCWQSNAVNIVLNARKGEGRFGNASVTQP